MKYITLVFLFTILTVNALHSQLNPIYRQISTKDGLLSNTVYSFHQLPTGRVIIGHNEGVNFYNGLKVLNTGWKEKTRSLVNFVQLDKNRTICRNFQGKSFLIEGDSVLKLDSSFNDLKYFKAAAKVIAVSPNEIYFLDKGLHKTQVLKNIEAEKIYNSTVQDSLLYMWVNYQDYRRLLVYNLFTEQLIFQKDYLDATFLYFHAFENMVVLQEQYKNIFYEAVKGIPNFNQPLLTLSTDEKITFIKKLQSGLILVGTYDGLQVYSKEFKFLKKYFSGIPISEFMEDMESNIWLGTLNEGIYIISDFDALEYSVEKNIERLATITNSILHRNKIVIGTIDGNLRALNIDGEVLWTTFLGKKEEVQALYSDSTENRLWAYCNALYEIDPKNGRIVHQYKVTSSKFIDRRKDVLVCGTSMGLCISDDNFNLHQQNLWVRKVFFLNDSILLFTTQHGLKYFNLKSRETTHDEHLKADISEITKWQGSIILHLQDSLYEWKDYKLRAFNWQKSNVLKIGTTSGLLYLITDDGTIFLWDGKKEYSISKYRGLFNERIQKVHLYNDQLICVSAKKILLIPIIKEFKPYNPNLNIIQQIGSFQSQHSKLISNYTSNRLDLRLELLPNIRSEGDGLIFYRIKGINEEWTEIPKFDYYYNLVLERLPYGNYVLELKGQNENGLESEITALKLVIKTPFYFQLWFLLLCSACLVAVAFGIFKWRLLIVERNNQRKLEKEQLKIKALSAELKAIRSQINPHLIFNSLSSIQTKVLSNKSKEAYEHLLVFSRLLRQALEYSSKEYISLENELSFLQNYIELEFLRKDDSFQFHFELDPKLNLKNEQIPSLLLQPFVENAILHGLMHQEGEKMLHVAVYALEKGYSVNISDNGIGREKSAKINEHRNKTHNSFAGKAIAERCEFINASGKMKVEIETSDLNPGTNIAIKITYNESHSR